MKSQAGIGVLLSVAGGIFWAISGVCGQFLFQYKGITSEWLVPVRLFSAGGILIVSALFSRCDMLSIWRQKRDIQDMLIFSLIGTAICQYSYFTTIATSNVATATFLSYTSPVFIIAFTAISIKKKPSLLEAAALIMILAGIFIISTRGDITKLAISPQALFWGVVSAAAFACYSVQPQRIMKKFDTRVVTGWGMLLGGGGLFLIFRPWNLQGIHDFSGFAAMAAIVIVGTILSYAFYLEGVKRIGATKSSLFAAVEPVVATILSVFLFQEAFHLMDLLGFAVIMATVFILAKSSGEKTQDSESIPSGVSVEPALHKGV